MEEDSVGVVFKILSAKVILKFELYSKSIMLEMLKLITSPEQIRILRILVYLFFQSRPQHSNSEEYKTHIHTSWRIAFLSIIFKDENTITCKSSMKKIKKVFLYLAII